MSPHQTTEVAIVDSRARARLDKRAAQIAETFTDAQHRLDIERIRAVDVKIRNIQQSVPMFGEIVLDEIADGTLANIDAALEEVTGSLEYLRQRVTDIADVKDYLLQSSIPEIKALHPIIERGYPLLQAYLTTITEIREVIFSVQSNPELANDRADSQVYKRLSAALQQVKQDFVAVANIGNEIQLNAAYLGYRAYLDKYRLNARRDEPVNETLLAAAA